MAFDFHDSLVGAYGELILSVHVAPRVERGTPPAPRRVLSISARNHHARIPRACHRTMAPAALHGRHRPRRSNARDRDIGDRGLTPGRRRSSTCASPTTAGNRCSIATRRSCAMTAARTWRRSSWRRRSARTKRNGDASTIHGHQFTEGDRSRRRQHHAVPRAVDAERVCRRFTPSKRWSPPRPDGRSTSASSSTRRRAGARGARALPAVREAFAALGVADIRVTTPQEREDTLARRAIAEGCTTLVAVGGDGTWSNVANAILHAGARLPPRADRRRHRATISPRPPGRRPRRRCAPPALRSRDPTAVSTSGRIEDHFFLNIAGFGFDIAVLEDIARIGWLRGDALYVVLRAPADRGIPRRGDRRGVTGGSARRCRAPDARGGQREQLRRLVPHRARRLDHRRRARRYFHSRCATAGGGCGCFWPPRAARTPRLPEVRRRAGRFVLPPVRRRRRATRPTASTGGPPQPSCGSSAARGRCAWSCRRASSRAVSPGRASIASVVKAISFAAPIPTYLATLAAGRLSTARCTSVRMPARASARWPSPALPARDWVRSPHPAGRHLRQRPRHRRRSTPVRRPPRSPRSPSCSATRMSDRSWRPARACAAFRAGERVVVNPLLCCEPRAITPRARRAPPDSIRAASHFTDGALPPGMFIGTTDR